MGEDVIMDNLKLAIAVAAYALLAALAIGTVIAWGREVNSRYRVMKRRRSYRG